MPRLYLPGLTVAKHNALNHAIAPLNSQTIGSHASRHAAGGSDAVFPVSRTNISDLFNSPFWSNIPDKPLDLINIWSIPSGTTSLTINGLNGDADKKYLLMFYGTLTVGTVGYDDFLLVQPNGLNISADHLATETLYDGTSAATSAWHFSAAGFILTMVAWGQSVNTAAVGILHAATGYVRQWQCLNHKHAPGKAANAHVVHNVGSFWSDTTTNITSLVLTRTAGTMAGTLALYRVKG